MGWIYLNTGVRVGIPVFIRELSCDPSLGNDFISHYNATVWVLKGALIVR